MLGDKHGPPCNICGKTTDFFSTSKILAKHQVKYFKCVACGFIQTEQPFWFDEAYSSVINSSDVGLVNRNIRLAKITRMIISVFFDNKGTFIDYGGGYGLFVRLMRDIGFDFYRNDKHCANLFAGDFEADADEKSEYEILTAFEVFEHLPRPIEEIGEMLTLSKNILFTTELLPDNVPEPGNWWYYGLEHGQHVSFFTIRSLKVIAEKFNLNLFSDGTYVHLLTSKRISPFLFKVFSRHEIASLYSLFPSTKSFIQEDFLKAVNKLNKQLGLEVNRKK